jgi:hypothetical protein
VFNRGENLNAIALNKHVGRTVQSPSAKTMPELAVRIATAVREDGLSDAKEPDHFVEESANVWRLWDTRTLSGEVAAVDTAIKAVGDKVKAGQSKRIAINLDVVGNDGATFARDMRAVVSADRKKPTDEQKVRGVKRIVVIKDGVVYPVYPF